jgi:hypothetical protein
MKRRKGLGFVVFLFLFLTACTNNKPYLSAADANQSSPTSTDKSTPTPKAPTQVAAPTPPEPPPQPPALQPGATPGGKFLAVSFGLKANQQADPAEGTWLPSADGNTIAPAGAGVPREVHRNQHEGEKYAGC